MRCPRCASTLLNVERVLIFEPEKDRMVVLVRCLSCFVPQQMTFWGSVAGGKEVKDDKDLSQVPK